MENNYEIIYVEMPISIEQKKEYNRRGYRVVDAEFAPEGYELPEGAVLEGEPTGFAADIDFVPVSGLQDEQPVKRTRRRRTETEE